MRQQDFFQSDEARKAAIQLRLMVNDPAYNTRQTFSALTGGSTSFVDKHMWYLSEHLNINVQHYLSNLRLKTKIRS